MKVTDVITQDDWPNVITQSEGCLDSPEGGGGGVSWGHGDSITQSSTETI